MVFCNNIPSPPLFWKIVFHNRSSFYGKGLLKHFSHTPTPFQNSISKTPIYNIPFRQNLNSAPLRNETTSATYLSPRQRRCRKAFQSHSHHRTHRRTSTPLTVCTTHPFNILLRVFQVISNFEGCRKQL